VGALASKAFQNNPLTQFFSGGMAGINMTSFMAAYSNGSFTGGIGAGQHNSKVDENDASEDEAVDADSEPVSAKTAAVAGVSVSGFSDGELIVEPSMDGDILVVTSADSGGSSSSSGGGDEAATAGSNSTGPADDTDKTDSSLQHSASNSSSSTSGAAVSDAVSAAAADSAGNLNADDEEVEEPAVKPAGSRPKVLDVMGGFMAGFWSHLRSQQL
jgi:hypothetical protein